MKRIEFGECRVSKRARQLVKNCLDSNWLTMGTQVKDFETKFADKFGFEYAVMVSSGTAADTAALMTLYPDAKEGDEIIVPALCFIAVANAVRAAGFKPVFVDIDRATLNINPDLIRDKITNRTRAIIAVNTMGRSCDVEKIQDICNDHNLKLIQDSCENHMGIHKGYLSSYYGDMSTYSFFTAHLVFGVEGGMVGTNDKETYDILRSIRSHGRQPDSQYFDHRRYGLNLKPTDLHASIALASLEELDQTFAKRRRIQQEFWGCDYLRDVCYLSEEEEGDVNCPHGFSLTVKKPKDFLTLVTTLDKYNIHHKRNFGCIPTQHQAFAHMGHIIGDFPEAEYVGSYGVHIGCHQYMTNPDIARVKQAFKEFRELV